jgi:hypothetical protein
MSEGEREQEPETCGRQFRKAEARPRNFLPPSRAAVASSSAGLPLTITSAMCDQQSYCNWARTG